MLTLKPHVDNVKLCDLRTGKKSVPVFWYPKRDCEMQNCVDNVSDFFTAEFRDCLLYTSDAADE